MKEFFILNESDFAMFKAELLAEIKELKSPQAREEWLRSAEVRDMLGISDSTLQTLRINGTIPAYRLGNTWFYKHNEILQALEAGRVKGGYHDAE